jgi:hypothetical protein
VGLDSIIHTCHAKRNWKYITWWLLDRVVTIGDFIEINNIGDYFFLSILLSNGSIKIVIESSDENKNLCLHFFDNLDGRENRRNEQFTSSLCCVRRDLRITDRQGFVFSLSLSTAATCCMPFGPECDWSRGHGQFTCLSPAWTGFHHFFDMFLFRVLLFTSWRVASQAICLSHLVTLFFHFFHLQFVHSVIAEKHAHSRSSFWMVNSWVKASWNTVARAFFCHVIRWPVLKFKTRKCGNLTENCNNVSENMMVL